MPTSQDVWSPMRIIVAMRASVKRCGLWRWPQQPCGAFASSFRAAGRRLCVPKTSSTPCGQAIFVDQATEASVFPDAALVEIGRLVWRVLRRGRPPGGGGPVGHVGGAVDAPGAPPRGL